MSGYEDDYGLLEPAIAREALQLRLRDAQWELDRAIEYTKRAQEKVREAEKALLEHKKLQRSNVVQGPWGKRK